MSAPLLPKAPVSALVIPESYPNKWSLSQSEAMGVLRHGPEFKWFRPFAEHLRVAPQTSAPWGYIHIYSEWGDAGNWTDADLMWEVVGFGSADALRWGLLSLFTRDHDYYALDVHGYLNDHNCHQVLYWLPGDPNDFPLRPGINQWVEGL